jgi:hypothetical protein
MLGKSFRSVVPAIFPHPNGRKLALVLLGAALLVGGCGGGSGGAVATKQVVGEGFRFRTYADWQVRHRVRLVEARDGNSLVSVSFAPLPRPFDESLWKRVVPEIDARAKELAAATGSTVESTATEQISGRRGRVYRLTRRGAPRRLGFVLDGRRQYLLYCRNSDAACDVLFQTFRLT